MQIKSRHRFLRALSTMSAAALDSLFPRTCRVCGQSLTVGERLLCVGCMADMPRTYLHRLDFNTIHQRVAGNHQIDLAAGWFYYYTDSSYARLIREAKYDDRPATARALGSLYGAELAADGLKGRFDVLLPVPLHRGKLLKRGYNQSLEMARGIASQLDCPVGDNLVAIRAHKTQTRRSGLERFKNVEGSFTLTHPGELDGLSVAVVDDIITTGSTILDCINVIADNSAPASLNILTIGVTHMR